MKTFSVGIGNFWQQLSKFSDGTTESYRSLDLPVPVLVNEEHPEVVGEGSEDGFVGFEEDISYSHGAVAQEAKLPLSVKLLQQDKTMVGQLHSSTCTKDTHTHTHKQQ